MKLLIVRHGDPDYSIDSLTPQGRIEAELLSRRLCKLPIAAAYVSPLGRAKDTAAYTLDKMGITPTVCDWLQEFPCRIQRPDRENAITWDWRPRDWANEDVFASAEEWYHHPVMVKGGVEEEFTRVTVGLDELLKAHGYVREGRLYRAANANEDTIVLFCHFGLECVLLSHLLHISPMLLWHGTCAAPSSVTTLITEEREKGFAYFRMSAFGDVSHLYAGGQEPSFAARFCETYDNMDQRH